MYILIENMTGYAGQFLYNSSVCLFIKVQNYCVGESKLNWLDFS